MKKRLNLHGKILALSIVGLAGILCFFALYVHFMPKKADVIVTDVIEETNLTYANTQEYILKDTKTHFLWLCDPQADDTIYIRDYIIKPLSEQNVSSDFENIELVDFHEAPDTVHYRSSVWGVNYIPSFIAVRNIDGEIKILNSLSWNKTSPFSANDLKDWMYNNGIWSGEYETIERIDQPVE